MHGITWLKWILPLLCWEYTVFKKMDLFFEQQWISPTILWVEGWFCWSCLESLGHLQSDSSWTEWAERSKMASFTCLVVGAACQLRYFGSSYLDSIQRTSQITCFPSACLSLPFFTPALFCSPLFFTVAWNFFF